ncbi:MAG: chorismate-binding protein [Solirubrobacteraceae bacterium]
MPERYPLTGAGMLRRVERPDLAPWRLVREPLGNLGAWPGVASALRGEQRPLALVGRWAGGGAILASEPLAVVRGPGALAVLGGAPGEGRGDAVGGGWFGWIAYEDGRALEPTVPPGPPAGLSAPTELAYYDHLLRLAPDGRWWFEALVTDARADALRARLAAVRGRTAAPGTAGLRDVRWRPPGPAGHAAAVAACVSRIAAGDLSQANLAATIEARADGHALDLLARGAATLAPDHGAAFASGERMVVSFSPELYLRRTGAAVASEPIKGTAAPGAAARAELLASAKDTAEHVMIVDLVRNDLGRVSEIGSVRVAALREPREQVGVQHLVSRIEGRLRPEASDADLIAATFPPGSVTGAPKVQALTLIGELEAVGRGVFCGAIGYRSPIAGLELSVPIRTLEVRGGAARLQVGGGIVSDSEPASEQVEVERKARPVLRALGADVPGPRPARAAAAPRALAHGRRPDPAAGLIETLRTEDGAAVAVDAHAARLAASARDVYGVEVDLAPALAAAARGTAGIGRLRADLTADGRLTTTWAPATPRAIEPLAPYVLPGGLGQHKWRDRALLDAMGRLGGTPLLLDADGEVLEAAWAAVVLVEGERRIAPPDDDRRLPSLTLRALPGLVREPFDLARLRAADDVLLAASVSGLVRPSAPA